MKSEISLDSHGGPIPRLVIQQLTLPNNGGLMQSLVACKYFACCQFGIFEAKFRSSGFYDALGFFENQKYQSKSGFFFFSFFSLKGLALAKHCLSCIFITNLF